MKHLVIATWRIQTLPCVVPDPALTFGGFGDDVSTYHVTLP